MNIYVYLKKTSQCLTHKEFHVLKVYSSMSNGLPGSLFLIITAVSPFSDEENVISTLQLFDYRENYTTWSAFEIEAHSW